MTDLKNSFTLDEYEIKASLIPAVFTSVPFLLFHLFYLNNLFNHLFVDFVNISKYITGISLPIIFIFCSMQLNRFIGKIIFENNIFNNENDFPTTQFLLLTNNEFSKDYKKKIRDKITSDFKIKLLNKNDEVNNFLEAKKIIIEVVGLIRNKVKKGRLLFIHNIQYGFFRNLIGGSIIAFLISLFNIFIGIIYSDNKFLFYSIVCLVIYSLPIYTSKFTIKTLGKLYAKRLFREFLLY